MKSPSGFRRPLIALDFRVAVDLAMAVVMMEIKGMVGLLPMVGHAVVCAVIAG